MLKRPLIAAPPETVAAQALGFLASDADRLARFLALSGLDPTRIRQAAGDPGFLPAVLEYLVADEPLLKAFAEEQGYRPDAVASASDELQRRGD